MKGKAVALLLLSCLTALLLVSCGIGTTGSVFDYGGDAFREVERHVGAWEPDRSDCSVELTQAYGTGGADYFVRRYISKGPYERDNGSRLQRAAKDRAGADYTIVAMDLGLGDGRVEPHWFAVPEGCQAIYEYDPAGSGGSCRRAVYNRRLRLPIGRGRF